jgi:hypothetical protein
MGAALLTRYVCEYDAISLVLGGQPLLRVEIVELTVLLDELCLKCVDSGK